MNKTAQHILVAVLGAGLVLMVGITLMERLQNPSLVQHVAPVQHKQAAKPQAQESPMAQLMRQAGDNPDDPQVQLQLAIMLLQEGNLDEAEVFLDKVQVLDVNNADVPYLKGYIANVRKDYPKAASLMEESIGLIEAPCPVIIGADLKAYLRESPVLCLCEGVIKEMLRYPHAPEILSDRYRDVSPVPDSRSVPLRSYLAASDDLPIRYCYGIYVPTLADLPNDVFLILWIDRSEIGGGERKVVRISSDDCHEFDDSRGVIFSYESIISIHAAHYNSENI